jgi:hypothetical protein
MVTANDYIPGIPIDPGNWHGSQICRPQVTCHRTYGAWAGDYSVIKSNGLAHLLIGKYEGQWVQFAPPNIRQYHDAVNVGYGVEITGINEEDFTDWQLRCMAYVVPWLEAMIGVPRLYSDGSDGWVDVNYWNGWHSHNMIIPSNGGSQHTNLWKVSDWQKIVNLVQGQDPIQPAPRKKGDSMLYVAESDSFFAPTGSFWLEAGHGPLRVGAGQTFEQVVHNWGALPVCPVPGVFIDNEIAKVLKEQQLMKNIANKVGAAIP